MKLHSVGFKITLVMTVALIILGVAVGTFSYSRSWDAFLNIYSDKACQFTRTTAPLLDGDRLRGYLETGETDAYYDEVKSMLTDMKAQYDMLYLYVFVPGDDSLTYIVEGQLPEDDPELISKLGDTFTYAPGGIEYTYLVDDVKNARSSDRVISAVDAVLGPSVTAWTPLIGADGSVVAVLEADFSMSEVQDLLHSYIVVVILMIAAAVIIVDVALAFIIRHLVGRPVQKLNDAVSAYAAGDELTAIDIKLNTRDELQSLSGAFTKMSHDISNYVDNLTKVTREKERIGTELAVATQIQANMLPRIFPPFPTHKEFSLFASMDPAKEVGGDFYDFFLTDDDHVALVVADVSGKGVPAALFMVIAKTLIKNCAQTGASPKEVLEKVNGQLCESNDADMFVTVWLGIMQISTGKMVCANAGHEYPAIMRAGGEFELFKDKHGFVLAGMEGARYREYELEFSKGDRLFMYTDGVPEATSEANELYGAERMLDALNRSRDLPIKDMMSAVRADMDAFVGKAPQFDDVTMLALEIDDLNK